MATVRLHARCVSSSLTAFHTVLARSSAWSQAHDSASRTASRYLSLNSCSIGGEHPRYIGPPAGSCAYSSSAASTVMCAAVCPGPMRKHQPRPIAFIARVVSATISRSVGSQPLPRRVPITRPVRLSRSTIGGLRSVPHPMPLRRPGRYGDGEVLAVPVHTAFSASSHATSAPAIGTLPLASFRD
eukprot:scaffold15642_cov120-Isochrysis_galbana.AAC.2